jgi:Putative addiction module component
MFATLPLHKMTVPEKLRVMEALWDDLSRKSNALDSPRWHEAALMERKARVASGKTSYMDWERAKKEIRRRVA